MTTVERITEPFKIAFPNLGLEFDINPTAFTVFGIEIQWYGIIITLGMLLAMIYGFSKMKRFGIDADRAIDAVIGGVVGGLIGARAYYVIFRWEDYAGDWKSILNFRNGGLAIYGGLIGAVAVGLLICKIRKVKMLPMLDVACIGFLIGQGIGRWGNFVNQEAFGTNTDSLFAMTGGTIQQTIINEAYYTDGEMALNGLAGMSADYGVHPCFLYESVWCLLGFVLLAWYSKRRKYDGQLLLMYLAWYGAERAVVEGFRTDSLMIGEIRVSQALSALLAVVSIIIQIVMYSKVKRDPESYVLYCNTEESKALISESEKLRSKSAKEEKADDGEKAPKIIEDDDEEDKNENAPDDGNDNINEKAEDIENGTDN